MKEKHTPPNNVKTARAYLARELREVSDSHIAIAQFPASEGYEDNWFDVAYLSGAPAAKNPSEGPQCPCLPWDECSCEPNNSD